MRIEIKARKVAVNDDLRTRVQKRFEKIARQVSPHAELEVELSEEQPRSEPQSQVVQATLRLKGKTLRCRGTGRTMVGAINECADDLARQVKRRQDKKRNHRPAPADPAVIRP